MMGEKTKQPFLSYLLATFQYIFTTISNTATNL